MNQRQQEATWDDAATREERDQLEAAQTRLATAKRALETLSPEDVKRALQRPTAALRAHQDSVKAELEHARLDLENAKRALAQAERAHPLPRINPLVSFTTLLVFASWCIGYLIGAPALQGSWWWARTLFFLGASVLVGLVFLRKRPSRWGS